MPRSAIVIGAGIAGLAIARALAVRGYKVTVIERHQKSSGASVRNFGMIWPVGQPDGHLFETAMLSRRIWKQVCTEAGVWYDEAGALHLAHSAEEWNVLQELAEKYSHRGYQLLNAAQAAAKSEAVVKNGLYGALYSADEMIVDPRKAIDRISDWLSEKLGVYFYRGKAATDVAYPAVYTGNDMYEADEIFICTGSDFETLYPHLFAAAPLIKCKLQMMRMTAQPERWRMGPALCGGLSLAHYSSFKVADSLEILKKKFEQEYPDYFRWGIHVMVSQNEEGELSIGDSHEYGMAPDPFDRHCVNRLILEYLKKIAHFPDETITETWNGIYPKLTNGESYWTAEPESGVRIIGGLGGAGMTLSFGLCEKLISNH